MTLPIADDEWQEREFVQALSTEKLPRRGKLQARDYRSTGAFRVIDQGQSEIAGWTDDASLVIDSGLPFVVFGDHTRAFKYVDHPFVLGADGTQLLAPSTEYCPRFFYFACVHLDLPSRGYSRHYTTLKEKSLPLPPKPEQQKITAILWKLQRAIAIQDRLIAATRDLKQSAMQHLFTHGLRGEPLKETEIGLMPESWDVARLDSCCDVLSSSLSYSDLLDVEDSATDASVKVHGIKVSDMNLSGNEVEITRANLLRHLESSLAERKTVPAETVVFPKRGAAIATNKKRLTTTWTVLDPNLIGVRPKQGLNYRYLFYWFEQFDLRTITEPGPTPQLNKKNLTPLQLPVPSTEDEQRDIAAALAALDRKLAHHQRKRTTLNDLFQTTLHQLMTAQIRVADLDIDTSEIAMPPLQGQAA